MSNKWFIKGTYDNQMLETTSNKYLDNSGNVFVPVLLNNTSNYTIHSYNGSNFPLSSPNQYEKLELAKFNKYGFRKWYISFPNLYNAYVSLDHSYMANVYILISFALVDSSYNIPSLLSPTNNLNDVSANTFTPIYINNNDTYLLKYNTYGQLLEYHKVTEQPSFLNMQIDYNNNVYLNIYRYYDFNPVFYDRNGIVTTLNLTEGEYNIYLKYDSIFNNIYYLYTKNGITTHTLTNVNNPNYFFIQHMLLPYYSVELTDNTNLTTINNNINHYQGIMYKIDINGNLVDYLLINYADYIMMNYIDNNIYVLVTVVNDNIEIKDKDNNTIFTKSSMSGHNSFLFSFDINLNLINWYHKSNTENNNNTQLYEFINYIDNPNYTNIYTTTNLIDASGIIITDQSDNVVLNIPNLQNYNIIQNYDTDGSLNWKVKYDSNISESNGIAGDLLQKRNNTYFQLVSDSSHNIIDNSGNIVYENPLSQTVYIYQLDSSGNIFDDFNPGGSGDPHIRTIYGEKYLLSNWDYVKLLHIDDKLKINARCKIIESKEINRMHRLEDGKIIKVSPNNKNDRFAYNNTYFDTIEIIFDKYIFEIKVDTFDIIKNTFPENILTLKDIVPENGIRCSIFNKEYPKVKCIQKNIYLFDKISIIIKSDNYWIDRNEIKFYLPRFENTKLQGAFVKNSLNNKLRNKITNKFKVNENSKYETI